MAYSMNLPAAARRHLEAADSLEPSRRKDVAGYLYGISAECAIKAMMIDAGLRPLPPERRREDPFFMHFPQLRTALLDVMQGRLAAPLRTFLSDQRFLSNWATTMRYAKGDEIQDAWVSVWKDQARQAVAAIGT